MERRIPLFAIILLLLFQIGCASKLPPEQPVLFPPAPSEPRLAYVRSFSGAADFQRISFMDRLLGYSLIQTFEKPFDVFVRNGRIFVSDIGKRAVFVINPEAEHVGLFGATGSVRLETPAGITGTSDGRIYVTDLDRKTVMVYDEQGTFVMSIGKPGELTNPIGVAVNESLQRLYIADSKAHTVMVYSTKGDFLFQFGGPGDQDGLFLHPSFLTVDKKSGNVYISDTNNFRVQVFDKDGKFLRKFGTLGDAPGYFQRPKGIALDSEGHSYVVEAQFNNFQIFNEAGQVLTWVGWGGQGGGGLFRSPSGMFIDDEDRIYVVDSINRRIQLYQYFSERWSKEHPDELNRYLGRPAVK